MGGQLVGLLLSVPEYGAYLMECADVIDRAIVLNDERKARREAEKAA